MTLVKSIAFSFTLLAPFHNQLDVILARNKTENAVNKWVLNMLRNFWEHGQESFKHLVRALGHFFDWNIVTEEACKVTKSCGQGLLNSFVRELLDHKFKELQGAHLGVHDKVPKVAPDKSSLKIV